MHRRSFLMGTVLACGMAMAQPPRVTKVEPPSWWLGSTVKPLRVMLRGVNLAGAQVEAPAPLRTGNIRVNARGTYLFVDLDIARARQAGPVRLTIRTGKGSAPAQFEILPPLSRAGRFQGFHSGDVLYLIMPDRFSNGDAANDNPAASPGLTDRAKRRYYHGGDLQGVIDRLPYLKSLGVTALWLNPWYDNNNRLNDVEKYDGEAITDYHGYGAIDFYAVEERLGNLGKLRELVDKAHAAGIKVVQDQVANHTGPYHPWVEDPPLEDWFHGTRARHLDEDWQTWTLMDPSATEQARRRTLDGWFINILPDLNHENAEARRYLIQNALWWVGVTGLDGIRQDTLPYVPRGFWAEWRDALAREFPSLSVVGEVLDGNPALVAFFQGGAKRFDGVDSRIEFLFDFPLHFALRRSFAQGQTIREVARVLAHDWLYPAPQRLVTLAGLHDVERFMNERGATIEGLKLAYTALFTLRGTPLIYYGDEIAMPGGNDPDNRRDFPGGWRGDARNAFTPEGRTPQQNDLWNHIQRLARLRQSSEALQTGATLLLEQTEQTLAYARQSAKQSVIAVFNNAAKSQEITFTAPAGVAGTLQDELSGRRIAVSQGRITVPLGPRTAAVLFAVRR